MKVLFPSTLLLALLALPLPVLAQESVTKPVLSAAPAPPQAPPPVQPVAPPVGPQASSTYIIGADDSISVSVWKEPGFSGTFPVRPDGMISIALVGDLPAAGRTPMDLAKELTNRLKQFVNDPTVTVSVLAVNSKRIFLLGEIAHIGPLPLNADMTPLQAIAAAGGLSPYAKRTKIYILRTVDGKQKKISFDYKKAIKDGDMQGVVLLAGDTIVVP